MVGASRFNGEKAARLRQMNVTSKEAQKGGYND